MKRPASVCAHLVTLDGLCVGFYFWLQILCEGSHGFDPTTHRLSLLAQVLNRFSPLHDSLPAYVGITLALLAITLDRRSPAAGPSAGFLRLYPISIATLSAAMLGASMWLWVRDFRFIPPTLLGWWEPRTWTLFAVPLFAFTISTYALTAFSITKRSIYAHLYAGVPLIVTIVSLSAFPAHWVEVELRCTLPSFFPRVPYILAAISVLAVTYFAARRIWARCVDVNGAAPVAAILVGTWGWALMSRGTLATTELFVYMGVNDSYFQAQRIAQEWTTVFFAALWCAIGCLNLGCRRRASADSMAS